MASGYFYIVHIREFITQNLPVYKIGRTESIEKRMKQYPKGSLFVLALPVNDQYMCEKEIKNMCKKKFKQCTEYGSEYFEADLAKLIKCSINIVNSKYYKIHEITKINKEGIDIINKEGIDIIYEYINECIEEVDKNINGLTIGDIYNNYVIWHKERYNSNPMPQNNLSKLLKNLYGNTKRTKKRRIWENIQFTKIT